MKRLLPALVTITLSQLSPLVAADEALRTEAKSLFGTIPQVMPGASQDTPEMRALGQKLYEDKRLSVNDQQACASCHVVSGKSGGVDNQPTSTGAKGDLGGRNAPTVLNAGFHVAQFWDGRAKDLVEQAKGPILNPVEMAMPSADAVVQKLNGIPEYVSAFASAFPGQNPALTYDNLARAIAAFERTLVTKDRFDRWLRGEDGAMNPEEVAGLKTFTATGCASCHAGPLLGGNAYRKMGLVNPYPTDDKGRIALTKQEADEYVFKVPALRNIALTNPYFHDGKVATLEEAVSKMAHHQLGKTLPEGEVKSIVAFLKALSDEARQ
jgi:cytochrome c peroxidase